MARSGADLNCFEVRFHRFDFRKYVIVDSRFARSRVDSVASKFAFRKTEVYQVWICLCFISLVESSLLREGSPAFVHNIHFPAKIKPAHLHRPPRATKYEVLLHTYCFLSRHFESVICRGQRWHRLCTTETLLPRRSQSQKMRKL